MASAASWPSPCRRRSGWPGTAHADDILVAYPTADRAALARLAGDPAAAAAITVMVDCPEHLDLIEKAAAGAWPSRHPVRVCIDIDAGYLALGGLLRAGARRSPVRTPADAAALAGPSSARPGLRLAGLMAYEAQIAGVGDNPAGRPAVRDGRPVRCSGRSGGRAGRAPGRDRRGGPRRWPRCEFVNGGGTGSIEKTAAEPAVTEIGAGSGLYQPRLFDGYRGFSGQPAALFALPVVRRPGPGVVTALGGGYLASGAGQPEPAAQPLPARRAAAGHAGGRGRGADAAARRGRGPAADR